MTPTYTIAVCVIASNTLFSKQQLPLYESSTVDAIESTLDNASLSAVVDWVLFQMYRLMDRARSTGSPRLLSKRRFNIAVRQFHVPFQLEEFRRLRKVHGCLWLWQDQNPVPSSFLRSWRNALQNKVDQIVENIPSLLVLTSHKKCTLTAACCVAAELDAILWLVDNDPTDGLRKQILSTLLGLILHRESVPFREDCPWYSQVMRVAQLQKNNPSDQQSCKSLLETFPLQICDCRDESSGTTTTREDRVFNLRPEERYEGNHESGTTCDPYDEQPIDPGTLEFRRILPPSSYERGLY